MADLRGYAKSISEATGVANPEDLAEIEDAMRHTIFHSTLDWQDRATFDKGAREAWEVVQIMRDPAALAAALGEEDPLGSGEFAPFAPEPPPPAIGRSRMTLEEFRQLRPGDRLRVDVSSTGHNGNDEEITLPAGMLAVVDRIDNYSPPQNRAVDLVVGLDPDNMVVNTWDEGDFPHYGGEVPLVRLD
jgi:hypothetical protein